MGSIVTSRARSLAAVLAVAAVAGVAATASHGASSASPFPPSAPSAAKWAQVIAKAKQEGSVTIYSAQAPASLADLAAKFKDKYGISVTVNRQVDSVMVQQITAEQGSGKPVADLWVQASKNYTLGAVKNKWVTPPIGPDYYAKGYNRKTLLGPGPTAIVAAAVLGMSWNPSLYPQGIKDIPDFLDPKLTGKIGVPQPTSASFIDWYLWLEDTYGKTILPKLAAQKPKIYLSSLTMMQAVISGEISASPFVPGLALDSKKSGAPIDFKLANKGRTWNSPFWGMILKNAPHPNAAQLLADYMVTKDGQAAVQHLAGAVIPGAPETLYVPSPRVPNLANFTPAKIADFQARWKALFQP
jgi:iron(III) transport system substrate-binding protein